MLRGRRKKYPAALTEIAAEVAKLRMDQGADEQEAMSLGFEVAEIIRKKWGGTQLYIPQGNNFYLSRRDEEILQELNGGNRAEVCSKYGISVRRSYQIESARRANKIHTERNQKP